MLFSPSRVGRKNGVSDCYFCPLVAGTGPLQGEGTVLIRDFLRLCPSTAGSEPKGHNVTMNRERTSLPHTLFILSRLQDSITGPRGPQAESRWRAVAWWGQGIGPSRVRRP